VCHVTYRILSQWQGGFQGDVTLQNTGTTTSTGWTVRITFPEGVTISQSWSAQMTKEGNTYIFRNYDWNGTIAPNQSTIFGFLGTWTSASPTPQSVSCSLQ